MNGRLIRFPAARARRAHPLPVEGNLALSSEPSEASTSASYSECIGGILADGTSTSAEYDSASRLVASADGAGARTEFSYDSAGRRVAVRDPAGRITAFGFDAKGNLIAETDPVGGVTLRHYDAMNRETLVIFPNGGRRETFHDSAGRIVLVRDENGNEVHTTYDALGRVAARTDDLGHSLRFEYDEVGGMTAYDDKTGDRIAFSQDQMGRRATARLAEGQTFAWTHDPAGNLAAFTDPRGLITTYTHDELNRRTADVLPGEAPINRTYTATGKVRTITRGSWTITFDYDERDRRTKATLPLDELSYSYDPVGRLSTITSLKLGLLVTYRRDSLGRVTEAEDGQGRITRYGYNTAGDLVGVEYPNGVEFTHEYDARRRRTQTTVTGPSGVLARWTYTLDGVGNRTQVSEVSSSRQYTYDDIYRLTSERITDPGLPSGGGQATYQYDFDQNRTQRTSTLTGVPNQTSTYTRNDELAGEVFDAAGNRTRDQAGATYAYNAVNELTDFNTGQSVFTYDGLGRRISKTSGGVTTWFLWDDQNPTGFPQVLAEFEGPDPATATPKRTFTYGLGLVSERNHASGATSFFIADHIGSTRQLTDEAGQTAATFDYDAFGNVLRQTGTRTTNHLFAGEYRDADMGLVYLRARWFDPSTGRLASRDPLFFDRIGELAAYAYAENDPVGKVDPSGEFIINLAGVSAFVGTLRTNFSRAQIGIYLRVIDTLGALRTFLGLPVLTVTAGVNAMLYRMQSGQGQALLQNMITVGQSPLGREMLRRMQTEVIFRMNLHMSSGGTAFTAAEFQLLVQLRNMLENAVGHGG